MLAGEKIASIQSPARAWSGVFVCELLGAQRRARACTQERIASAFERPKCPQGRLVHASLREAQTKGQRD